MKDQKQEINERDVLKEIVDFTLLKEASDWDRYMKTEYYSRVDNRED